MGQIIQGEIGAVSGGQLVKTGQTTQYNSKEDDGYWEKGISKKYVVLSSGQYSGTVDIVLNAKTHTLSNNCVFDKRTGLMWARYVPDGDIGPDGDGMLYWIDDTNDEDIYDFKDQADAKKLGGHAGWRVPSITELLSLFVYDGGVSPRIDTTAFPSTPISPFWCGNTKLTDALKAFYIHSGAVSILGNTKTTGKWGCRLVRGG